MGLDGVSAVVRGGAVIPLSGWMTERFGSKRTWIASIVLFAVGSALCALATRVIDMASDEGPVPERTVTVCERYAHLTAMLIATTFAGLCGIGSCRDQHA